ncbi:MAG: hypothetical protein E7597_07805 [Ruminococcaceae bacterium]|nr:hypothetical protein [Oscillospiraceae bacterium]
MKKLFIILFTFVLLASYSQMLAFAVENDAFKPVESGLIEDETEDVRDNGKSEAKPEDKPEKGEKPHHNGETIPTIGANDDKGEKETNIEINFSTERLPTALKHMGVGLAGVMLVLILIGVVVFVLNKFFKP